VLAQHLSQPLKPKEQKPMYLNRVTLIGFTGQDPKTSATQSGKEITRLSVATTRRYQQDSEWKEKTQWHDCVLYGGPAQYAANLPKGTHVLIEGELTYREYNRTIETESASVNVQWPVVEIVVETIKVLDRRKREGHGMEGAA
jgi:single-strand DNA-binding protein